MQSDLGLAEWLQDNVTEADTGRIQYALDYSDGPLKANVLSHEIKFQVTTSGNVTPGWKLKIWQVNQNGTLLSASRDRINDLTITLGPTVPTPTTKINAQGQPVTTTAYVPSAQAADAALASQIGLAVANAIKAPCSHSVTKTCFQRKRGFMTNTTSGTASSGQERMQAVILPTSARQRSYRVNVFDITVIR